MNAYVQHAEVAPNVMLVAWSAFYSAALRDKYLQDSSRRECSKAKAAIDAELAARRAIIVQGRLQRGLQPFTDIHTFP